MKTVKDLWAMLPAPVQYVVIGVAVVFVITVVYRTMLDIPLAG